MIDNPLQAYFNGMAAEWQRERAETQLTLGKMIKVLEQMPAGQEIDGIGEPHSYRGYYQDLAFSRQTGKITVAAALAMCKNCMGQVFTGYKGGDFVMGALTPVWIAYYGDCGDRIMALTPDGTIETAPEKD